MVVLVIRWSCAVLVVLVGGLAGCRSSGNFANDNDRLRAEVLDLESENAELRRRAAELETALAEAARVPDSVSEEALASTPRLAEISIAARSRLAEEDPDGSPSTPTLLVYVETRDGRGRFLQVTGTLSVHAAVLPEAGDAVTIARRTLGPAALREAYRSLAGTHYTVEVPTELPAGIEAGEEIDVRVVFTDAYSGQRFEAHAAVPWR